MSEPAKSCCSLPDGNHAPCCEDIVIRVDFDTDHVFSEQITINQPFEFDLFSEAVRDIELTGTTSNQPLFEKPFNEFSPPDIYKLNHSFLFYG